METRKHRKAASRVKPLGRSGTAAVVRCDHGVVSAEAVQYWWARWGPVSLGCVTMSRRNRSSSGTVTGISPASLLTAFMTHRGKGTRLCAWLWLDAGLAGRRGSRSGAGVPGEGERFDFQQQFGPDQCHDLHCRARRKVVCTGKLRAYGADGRHVCDISDVVGQLDDIVECSPGSGQAAPKVLENLPSLSLRVTLSDNLAVFIQRHLTRHRDQPA